MTIKISAKMLGDRKLGKALNRLDAGIIKKVMKPAIRVGGKPVLAQVRANARGLQTEPTGGGSTGEAKKIAKGIKMRSLFRSRKRYGIAIFTQRDEEGTAAKIALGTQYTAPKPFMRDAIKQKRTVAVRAIRRKAWSGIKKLGGGRGN